MTEAGDEVVAASTEMETYTLPKELVSELNQFEMARANLFAQQQMLLNGFLYGRGLAATPPWVVDLRKGTVSRPRLPSSE